MYSLKSSTGCPSAPNKAKSKVRDTTEMSCDNVDTSDCDSTNRENSNTLDRQFIIGLTAHNQK